MATSKYVRAKVRALEHIPEWAFCCDAPMRSDRKDDEELTVDVSRTTIRHGERCSYCRTMFPDHRAVWSITKSGSEGWFPIEVLDLDEAEVGAERIYRNDY